MPLILYAGGDSYSFINHDYKKVLIYKVLLNSIEKNHKMFLMPFTASELWGNTHYYVIYRANIKVLVYSK